GPVEAFVFTLELGVDVYVIGMAADTFNLDLDRCRAVFQRIQQVRRTHLAIRPFRPSGGVDPVAPCDDRAGSRIGLNQLELARRLVGEIALEFVEGLAGTTRHLADSWNNCRLRERNT